MILLYQITLTFMLVNFAMFLLGRFLELGTEGIAFKIFYATIIPSYILGVGSALHWVWS